MNILHTVEFYWPHMGGSQEVVRQISECLSRFGHSVTVATSKHAKRNGKTMNGVTIRDFQVTGNEICGFRGEAETYREFVLDSRFDVMMNYGAQLWSTDLVLPLLPKLKHKKILAPCGFWGLFEPRFQEYFARMPDRLRQYEGLIFHSSTYRDIAFARDHGLTHCAIIANGACEKEFDDTTEGDHSFREHYAIPFEAPLILSVGNHEKLKGHALIIEAFKRARIKSGTLVIIGRPLGYSTCLPKCVVQAAQTRLFSFGRKKVLFLNPPRADVVKAYRAADLFVLGSDLECSPVVLFEALASATPFIATDCGNVREIAGWSNGGIVVEGQRLEGGRIRTEPAMMAKAIEELLANEAQRKALGEAGHEVWKSRYTWSHISRQYEKLYQSLL
jgi:L-malate glycosyltransferase